MHVPVLLNEVLSILRPRSGGRYLDVTVGGGGHSERLLDVSGPDGCVLGTDADSSAIARAADRLKPFGARAMLRQAWLDEAPSVARELGFDAFDGVLADLGLSSNQLDDDARGFSFSKDGPLDMRFDIRRGESATDLVNRADVAELTRILREYGEVDRARQVAEAIWAARPLKTTAQLRDAVAGVARSRGHIHPATQVFQALRIAVNDELRRLADGLPGLIDLLAPGGRLAVITFHSLEDRIVKRTFRDLATASAVQPGFGPEAPEVRVHINLVTRKPIEASQDEVSTNPRARSAKLRAVEKSA